VDHPFTILGFPSNQFKNQEPGSNATEILRGLEFVRPGNGFKPKFPMLAKTEVNGENETPIFKFLKSRCVAPLEDFRPRIGLLYEPFHARDIRWNFEKFLVDANGAPVFRYQPDVDPLEFEDDIKMLLGIKKNNTTTRINKRTLRQTKH